MPAASGVSGAIALLRLLPWRLTTPCGCPSDAATLLAAGELERMPPRASPRPAACAARPRPTGRRPGRSETGMHSSGMRDRSTSAHAIAPGLVTKLAMKCSMNPSISSPVTTHLARRLRGQVGAAVVLLPWWLVGAPSAARRFASPRRKKLVESLYASCETDNDASCETDRGCTDNTPAHVCCRARLGAAAVARPAAVAAVATP